MNEILNNKDSARRKLLLQGNMWRVVLSISLPLAIYNCLSNLFGFLDTLMAAQISSEVVSAVAYLVQIKSAINAIGIGLAIGGGIIIARYYGAGDIKNAKKSVNTLLFLAISIGCGLLIVIVPFTKPLLRFINTPEELISIGSNYFIVEMIMIVSIFINNVYISVEKAKGNTKKILYLNLMVLSIKLPLTALFVFVFEFGVTMMAVATLIAHLALTIIAIWDLLRKGNIFRLSIKDLELSSRIILPMITLAIPIFFEKFVFSFGKIMVNSMSVLYGSTIVGALGVSNNISGIITGTSDGFQDGEMTIISQNLGNGNVERALDAFKKTLVFSLLVGGVGFLFTGIFMDQITALFSRGDMEFATEIKEIFKYERYAIITLTFTSAAMGLLYGLGYTKISLAINFTRLFIYRIPLLYILQNFTTLGSESVGIAMMISNFLVGITSGVVCFVVIKRLKRKIPKPKFAP